MTSLTTFVIRIFALISCFYGLYEDDGGEKLRYVFNLYRPPKFLQLTQLCLLFVVIIDFIGLIQHRIKCAMKEGLGIMRNILIVNCVGLSSVVFFGFWGLYFYDSRLIILKEMHDLGYKPPMSCNLSEHVFPFIFILYEFFAEEVEVIWGILLIPFSFIYYFASEYYFKRIGRWQYGILNEVNTFARVLLFAEFTILALITIVSVHLIKTKVKDLRTRNLKID